MDPCKIVIQDIGDDPSNPPPPTLVIECTKDLIADAKWGPKCETIVSVCVDGKIRVHCAKSGELVNEIVHTEDGNNTELTCIEYSKDGTRFAVCGRDKVIKLYNAQTFE